MARDGVAGIDGSGREVVWTKIFGMMHMHYRLARVVSRLSLVLESARVVLEGRVVRQGEHVISPSQRLLEPVLVSVMKGGKDVFQSRRFLSWPHGIGHIHSGWHTAMVCDGGE